MAEKKKFSLAEQIGATVGSTSIAAMDAAATVSESDTKGREQIEYIDVDRLIPNEKNFYSLDGIEELADNIELIGLQQPLRVRPMQDGAGNYTIESGHRRRAAIKQLVDAGKEQFRQVACIVEHGHESEAMRELRLIYANAATRKMTDADLAKQAERVTELLYQLKEEGVEFPAGRMRDLVAEACKVSATKIATLKVIQEKLPEQYKAEWNAGKITTDAAYKLAKSPAELQARICKAYPKTAPDARAMDRLADVHKERKGCLWEPKLKCPDGSACSHGDAFLRHDAVCYAYDHCGGKTCCCKCEKALRDWSPCGSACAKAKQARAEKQAQKKTDAQKTAERERLAMWKKIGKSARRLLLAVEAAELPDKTRLPQSISGKRLTVGNLREIAGGSQTWTELQAPYWNPLHCELGTKERELCELLGCTADFLFGLTDEPRATAVPTSAQSTTDAAPQWRTGTPEREGRYWCSYMDPLIHLQTRWIMYWSGALWYREEGGEELKGGVLAWYPLPEEDKG